VQQVNIVRCARFSGSDDSWHRRHHHPSILSFFLLFVADAHEIEYGRTEDQFGKDDAICRLMDVCSTVLLFISGGIMVDAVCRRTRGIMMDGLDKLTFETIFFSLTL
jgi:hypothetical protein